jgi:hypothetical protein
MAYNLYQWLQTNDANDVIQESGYIPINTTQYVTTIPHPNIRIFPNPTTDQFTVRGLQETTTITLHDAAGHVVLTKTVDNNETVNVKHLPKGIYLVTVGLSPNMTAKLIKK